MTAPDHLAEIHDRLITAVEKICTGDDWQRMLDVARQFHTYSTGNVWLILAQRENATRVAGYRTWQRLGRQVRRGERGIAILAPVITRPQDGEDRDDTDTELVLCGFRVVHVFDIAQTDGDPLPDVDRPCLLTGDDPCALWDALAAQVHDAGFTLSRGDCDGANGCTNYATRTVRVRDDVSPAQAAKTLAHELAHVLLHEGTTVRCRGRVEVEAESVAYLVCTTVGITADDYSFDYLAGWSGGDPAVVQEAAAAAISCARSILEPLTTQTEGGGDGPEFASDSVDADARS